MNREDLVKAAKEAMQRAYAPYSRFSVGAALLCADGRVYTGCNIENASFGCTNCAERTALYKAVSDGERDFKMMAVIGESEERITPCGACRQVLAEFCGSEFALLLCDAAGSYRETTLDELLPMRFSL